ncbi:MAG: hypothetical protein WCJ37_12805, partial [Syntrophus sp. (in: bacteria)]
PKSCIVLNHNACQGRLNDGNIVHIDDFICFFYKNDPPHISQKYLSLPPEMRKTFRRVNRPTHFYTKANEDMA